MVMDRATGTILTQLDADQPFPALSLVKLMIAADTLSGAGADAAPTMDDAPAGSDAPAEPPARTNLQGRPRWAR